MVEYNLETIVCVGRSSRYVKTAVKSWEDLVDVFVG
jgi:hypothetical protein